MVQNKGIDMDVMDIEGPYSGLNDTFIVWPEGPSFCALDRPSVCQRAKFKFDLKGPTINRGHK